LVEEPVIPLHAKNLMKYSAKYAHYGPVTTKRGIHFDSLKAYVDTAVGGTIEQVMPEWLIVR
jgi:predicted aconitase